MEADDECGYQVELYVYDLTKGLARTLSAQLLGKQIDGVWHTGIVVYGREYFFGSNGIESCKPGGTVLGEPERIEALGESQVPYQLFLDYIFGLGEADYRPGVYDLLKHNCNNFSDEIAQFLCGRGVPKAILQLPEEVLNTPLGLTLNEALKKVELKHANSRSINYGPLTNSLRPAIQIVRGTYDDPEFDELNDAIDQVRHNSVILEERRNSLNEKISKKERKEKRREKRERKEKRRKEKSSDESEERNQKRKKNKPPIAPTNCAAQPSAPSSSSLQPCIEESAAAQDIGENNEPQNTSVDNDAPEVNTELNNTIDRLSLSEPTPTEDNDTWEPVDDFWGNQDDESPSTSVVVSETDEGIDTLPATTDLSEDLNRLQNTDNSEIIDSQTDYTRDDVEPQQTDTQDEIDPQQTDTQDEIDPQLLDTQDNIDPQQSDMEESTPQDAVESSPPHAPLQETESEPVPEVEREPPILFKEDTDARRDFDDLVGCCMHMLSNEEQHHMEELRAYVVEDDGAWALSENFGDLFSRLFHDENIPERAKRNLLRILAVAALKDDVILLLHQDRKDHTIMNFVNKIEHLSPDLQEAIALFFCNMFEHLSPSEWLLYISEWPQEGGQPISNIRVTTKVAVNALLHSNDKVQNYGTALMYNLGTKEVKTVVFDDVAPELAMAILQFFNTKPKEELLWRTITALCRFCYASSEVPSLIKMIGPEPDTFKGMSERIDTVIEEINAKLTRVRHF